MLPVRVRAVGFAASEKFRFVEPVSDAGDKIVIQEFVFVAPHTQPIGVFTKTEADWELALNTDGCVKE